MTIDYLKMDIEGSEWRSIPDMAQKGLLKNIKQIGFEIHRFYDGTHVYNLIRILHLHGFRKWKINFNQLCVYIEKRTKQTTSRCIEIYFLNLHFSGIQNINSWRNDNEINFEPDSYTKDFPDYAAAYDYQAWPDDLIWKKLFGRKANNKK